MTFRRDVPALLAVAAVFFSVLTGCSTEEPVVDTGPLPVKMLEVSDRLLRPGREFPGVAKATDSAELSFQVSGRIVNFPVAEGDQVAAGDLIAKLDTRDYVARVEVIQGQLSQAEATLQAMQVGARPEDILRLEAQLGARQAEFHEAELGFNRQKTLLDEGAASREDYDSAEAQYEVAKAYLRSAEQELEIGKSGARAEDIAGQMASVEGLKAQLKEVQNALDYATLTAPFAGRVAAKYSSNFEDISAKQEIILLQDISQIEIDVDLSERDMAAGVRLGVDNQEIIENFAADVSFAAIPEVTFEARIDSFQTVADPITQTFRVTLIMDQPKGVADSIFPGMNALIVPRETQIQQGRQGIFVPLSAVLSTPDGKSAIWKVTNGKVYKTPVGVGEVIGDKIDIVSGLETGESIAISAIHTLTEGMAVRPMGNLKDL